MEKFMSLERVVCVRLVYVADIVFVMVHSDAHTV